MMYLIVFAFFALGDCMSYTDFFARNISLPLSAALYSSDATSCLQKTLNSSVEVIKQYRMFLRKGSCSAIIVSIPEHNAIALSFQASFAESSSWAGWEESFFPLNEWRPESGKVSKFLSEAFKQLWEKGGMKSDFQDIAQRRVKDKVWITGHSFGGGVAALAAFTIVADGIASKDRVALVTLGAPMVGDKEFVQTYEKMVESSFRVVRRGDMVPLLPEPHRGYEYNGIEVFYDKFGMQSNGITGFKICTNSSEEGCSETQENPVGFIGNEVYFRRNVTQYGMKCK